MKNKEKINKDDKARVLERLRAKRALGRRNEVTVGAHMLKLRKEGAVTKDEFDYVMGITDTNVKGSASVGAKK